MPSVLRALFSIPSLSLLLISVALLSLMQGAIALTPLQVFTILFQPFSIQLPGEVTVLQQTVVLHIRLPRVLLGMLVGSSLAMGGAVMQGLFRNALADPTLLGVSSGAAVAAVTVIVLDTTLFGLYTLPIAAFIGGLFATWLVYKLAQSSDGYTSVATLLLAGIAVNAFTSAAIALLTYLADAEQLRTVVFWNMGSLGRATWTQISMAAPFICLTLVILPYYARSLNVFTLGEVEAQHLGFDVEQIKRILLLLVALSVGASVAAVGAIAFIGLVVPHIVRLAWGPDHRRLLPGTALLGASLLLSADVLARVIVAPAELPIGIVTALVGGPFFLWLLWKQR